MLWYYASQGVRKGPVEDAEFRNLVAQGTIGPDDLVWNETFGPAWKPARSVDGISFPTSVPPPPPAPPVLPATPVPAPDAAFASRTHNRDLTTAARQALRDRWGIAIAVSIVIGAIEGGLSLFAQIPFAGLVFSIGSLLITGALNLGVATFWLSLSRTGNGDFNQAFSGFARFGDALVANLLAGIFVCIGILLLIVPGIIVALMLSQTFFILADNPRMDAIDALRRSRQMMRGNKWKYFCMQWRFFGWVLLCLLTCGIGFIWLVPYMSMSFTKFYEDLKPA
jgi:uncharacterized membrane protein